MARDANFLKSLRKMSYFCPPFTQIGMCLISNLLQIASTFHENPSGGRHFVPWGWTDRQTKRHDESNSRFAKLSCNTASIM